jgi:hypothetical protein
VSAIVVKFDSMIAARKVHFPLALAQTPFDGSASGASAVLFTVNVFPADRGAREVDKGLWAAWTGFVGMDAKKAIPMNAVSMKFVLCHRVEYIRHLITLSNIDKNHYTCDMRPEFAP